MGAVDAVLNTALAAATDLLEWRTVDDGIQVPDEGDRALVTPGDRSGTITDVDNLSIAVATDDGDTALVPVEQVEPLSEGFDEDVERRAKKAARAWLEQQHPRGETTPGTNSGSFAPAGDTPEASWDAWDDGPRSTDDVEHAKELMAKVRETVSPLATLTWASGHGRRSKRRGTVISHGPDHVHVLAADTADHMRVAPQRIISVYPSRVADPRDIMRQLRAAWVDAREQADGAQTPAERRIFSQLARQAGESMRALKPAIEDAVNTVEREEEAERLRLAILLARLRREEEKNAKLRLEIELEATKRGRKLSESEMDEATAYAAALVEVWRESEHPRGKTSRGTNSGSFTATPSRSRANLLFGNGHRINHRPGDYARGLMVLPGSPTGDAYEVHTWPAQAVDHAGYLDGGIAEQDLAGEEYGRAARVAWHVADRARARINAYDRDYGTDRFGDDLAEPEYVAFNLDEEGRVLLHSTDGTVNGKRLEARLKALIADALHDDLAEDLGEAARARSIAAELLSEGKAGGKLFGMGNATYDVEKMHAAAEGKPTVDIDARQFSHAFGEVRIEPTYAMKTNLSKPVLLAAAPNGAVRLVDGWHRAYKAAHVGKPLKGRVLGEHELEACRVTEAAGASDVPAVIEPGDRVDFYTDDASEPWPGTVDRNDETGIHVRARDQQVWPGTQRTVITTLGDRDAHGNLANHLVARDAETRAVEAALRVLSGGSTDPAPFD